MTRMMWAHYRGYIIRHGLTDKVGAYTDNSGEPWFEGETEREVREKIDKALSEVPEPVYWEVPGSNIPNRTERT